VVKNTNSKRKRKAWGQKKTFDFVGKLIKNPNAKEKGGFVYEAQRRVKESALLEQALKNESQLEQTSRDQQSHEEVGKGGNGGARNEQEKGKHIEHPLPIKEIVIESSWSNSYFDIGAAGTRYTIRLQEKETDGGRYSH
jgi:hypothetical protein